MIAIKTVPMKALFRSQMSEQPNESNWPNAKLVLAKNKHLHIRNE